MIFAGEDDLARFGSLLASRLQPGDVVALLGPLGVGKTSLARSVLKALGHEGEVPSPSFALVQPYTHLHPPAWHVDLYRIEDRSELDELGLEEACDGILLVEWPERAGEEAWPQALRLSLDFVAGGGRRLTAVVPSSWQSRWPPR